MSKPTALGANIFAGLFTKGIKDAGFEVLGHLEHGPYGVATAKLNFPKLEVRVGRENWKETDFKGKVDFMYTNPPCAAWSNAGTKRSTRGSWETQVDRLRCVYDCVEAGIAIRPKAWCWESVTQAWVAGRSFVTEQAERWCDAGYHVTVLIQDNQFLGVPQARRRMFLIAHQHPLVWPKLTETTTVREVLESVKNKKSAQTLNEHRLTPYYKRLWKLSKEYGGYMRKTFEVEGRGNIEGPTPSVLERRLPLDKPAPVMLSADKRMHPTQCRYLDWKEWLAFCGLPLDWKTAQPTLEPATYELARAVMPGVGKWLGKAVKDGLKLPKLRGQPIARVVNFTDPEHPSDVELFRFSGLTMKRTVPPPLPPLGTKPARVTKVDVALSGSEGKRKGPKAPAVAYVQKKPGSGKRIRELLRKGWDAERILETIHKEFPGSKATKSDVSWNRGAMKPGGRFEHEEAS